MANQDQLRQSRVQPSSSRTLSSSSRSGVGLEMVLVKLCAVVVMVYSLIEVYKAFIFPSTCMADTIMVLMVHHHEQQATPGGGLEAGKGGGGSEGGRGLSSGLE